MKMTEEHRKKLGAKSKLQWDNRKGLITDKEYGKRMDLLNSQLKSTIMDNLWKEYEGAGNENRMS